MKRWIKWAMVFTLATVLAVSAAVAETQDSNADVSEIVSVWFEDAADPRILTVNPDETYTLEASDGSVTTGTVMVEYEVYSDGSSVAWYDFYENGTDFWAGFCRDETEDPQLDLWAGQDGSMHFRRDTALYDSFEEAEDNGEFLGVWGCGRCTLVVEQSDDGYLVSIQWASSAAEGSVWEYPCRFDAAEGVLYCSDGGTRTDYVYDSDGNHTDTVVYEDGAATFALDGGVLRWTDDKEDMGDAMEFIQGPDA